MSIQGIEQARGPLLPDPLRQIERPDDRAASTTVAGGGSAPGGQDWVEIPDAARQLARSAEAHAADEVHDAEPASVDPERLRTILDRLGERLYDRRGVQIEIAQRMLPDLVSIRPQ